MKKPRQFAPKKLHLAVKPVRGGVSVRAGVRAGMGNLKYN